MSRRANGNDMTCEQKRRNGVEGRVLAALKTGNMTALEVATLISVPHESARQCLARLLRNGVVRVIERKKCRSFGGVATGQPVCVFEMVT
jgi:predicted ArsR family transcriptional regulator